MKTIEDLYFKNATIILCPNDKKKFESSKSHFMQFLEADQREIFKNLTSPQTRITRMLSLLKKLR